MAKNTFSLILIKISSFPFRLISHFFEYFKIDNIDKDLKKSLEIIDKCSLVKIDEKLKTIQRGFPIIKDILKIDGLRINFEYGFALIRASNTHNVIVTKYEATSYATAMSYKNAIENLINEVINEINSTTN